MYKYFISYNYTDRNGFGFGRSEIRLAKKIKNIDDVYEIEKILKEKHKEFTSIVILNYKLFKEE